jgi:GntR family trehalose operon transcriptional repressor
MQVAYDAIYFDIKRDIENGKYKYKDFLPSENVLISEYNCAHNTVRKALAVLASNGYVLPIHGRGVRVIYKSSPLLTSSPPQFAPKGFNAYTREEAGEDVDRTTRILDMKTIVVESQLASDTGFDEGTVVTRIERVRSFNGRATHREVNYVRADLAKNMTQEDAEGSIYRFIDERTDATVTAQKQLITVQPADEYDRALLDLRESNHVVVVYVISFDNSALVCEVSEVRHEPSSFTFLSSTVRSILDQR